MSRFLRQRRWRQLSVSVVGVVVLVVEGAEEDAEQLPAILIHVVRGLLKPQAPAIVKIHGELGGKTLAEHLNRR